MSDRFQLPIINGTKIVTEAGLDGGGINHLPDFIDAVKNHGKEKYKHGLEWCAGFGAIGFYFLTEGICELMSFNDCYGASLECCRETAILNGLSDQVFTYHADSIGMINTDHKWDLVLANPPHCFTQETKQWLIDGNHGDHSVRITCDVDYAAHKEFFKNIVNYMDPDGDIFISEVAGFEDIAKLGEEGGLTLVSMIEAPMLKKDSTPHAKIMHFKVAK